MKTNYIKLGDKLTYPIITNVNEIIKIYKNQRGGANKQRINIDTFKKIYKLCGTLLDLNIINENLSLSEYLIKCYDNYNNTNNKFTIIFYVIENNKYIIMNNDQKINEEIFNIKLSKMINGENQYHILYKFEHNNKKFYIHPNSIM